MFLGITFFMPLAALRTTLNKTASRHENGNKFDPSSTHLGNNLPPTIAESVYYRFRYPIVFYSIKIVNSARIIKFKKMNDTD